MRLRRLLLLTAYTYGVIGAAFALWPYETLRQFGLEPLGPLLGMDPDPARRLPVFVLLAFTRLFGTTMLGVGVIAFFLRGAASPEAQKAVVTALFTFNLLLAAMTVTQQQSILSSGGSAGWLLASLFGALCAAFGWLLFTARGVAPVGPGVRSDLTLGELRESWLHDLSEAAAQQERTRLARDLHDSIKQQLFSINVNAAACQARFEGDAHGAREAVQQVREAAQEAMAEMEAMLLQLQPAPLATVGLVEALRKQCEATGYRSGASVTLDISGLPSTGEIPTDTQSALFRIAQEALSNVARHARASQVTVRISRPARPGPWSLLLCIEDDGAGFDAAATQRGMGLSNLEARAREIGAALEVDSARGRGTRVVVRVPVQVSNAAGISGRLQRAALLGLAAIFLIGLPGRPLVGGWWWWLLPWFAFASKLAIQELRRARGEIAELANRLGASSADALRLDVRQGQCVGLLIAAFGAWNPVSTWILHNLGPLTIRRASGAAEKQAELAFVTPVPYALLAAVAVVGLLVAGWWVHRGLARLRAQLPAERFSGELRDALEPWFLPLAVLLCTMGMLVVFLHEPTAPLLPVLLLLWLAPVGYWCTTSWATAYPATSSPTASSRCCGGWRRVAPTARSARRCASARRPSRRKSATSSASCT